MTENCSFKLQLWLPVANYSFDVEIVNGIIMTNKNTLSIILLDLIHALKVNWVRNVNGMM